jgi:predicted N-acetyltransferase YhbS
MGIAIRPAVKTDTPALENFLVSVSSEKSRSLAQNYIKAMFSEDYRKPSFIIAADEEKIVGSAAFSEELFTTSTWGISWVGVAESYRNQGLGQRLVEECCNEIKRRAQKTVTVILGTYPDKTKLYERCGFRAAGQDHHGGWYMLKTLEA